MATSSLLGIDADNLPPAHNATGIDSLGPSDASDSGSDSAGVYSADPDSDTDRFGTGERGAVEPDGEDAPRDILPDHIETSSPDGSDREGEEGPDSKAVTTDPDALPQEEDDGEAEEDPDAL